MAEQGEKKQSKLMKIAWAIAQQDESPYTISMKFYRRTHQIVCGCIAGFIVLGTGGLMMMQSGNYQEVKIEYTSADQVVTFDIDNAFTGDVFVYYEMTDLFLNHKTYVESKDPLSIYKFMGAAQCENADTKEWATLRRGTDTSFMARINAQPGNTLLPCGLVSLSTFTDRYEFQLDIGGGDWEDIDADESDITLANEGEKAFGKFEEEDGIYKIDGQQTWITPDTWKHWQVWQRTPAGSHVLRNQWAVIRGGLQAGKYRVNLIENSAIWEEWGASKTIVLANTIGFGNGGAAAGLSFICFGLFAMELICVCGFMILRATQKPQPLEDRVEARLLGRGLEARPAQV
eukprot:CAMPEP_0197628520 /NCGR_PEP_ID=MMETSP1338-20131121/6797_1 /TAXON_ID=43686 ORGANISM="Pelagodinium beii, Strain RCC1491" /NCGR_SAMPLE_ID=MMETSP1338 /ASSEMBLY_ACC=CAM_ASM_000754 /LENGTH=344 /DNA_ID=CAMNT_0043199503 /DNA_START=51 /DNA_END=1085 /DNA_ORIENTATION=+